ncbi:MAG: FxsA family protein [Spirochaetaceae bacterium]|nr:FxsA family protein [Spirochaetaceae bacterium]
MLNFRFLDILIRPRSVQIYLGIIAILGAGVLIDIILFLKLAIIIGPWITMTILAANTAFGIFIMYHLMDQSNQQLIMSIDNGKYDSDIFYKYLNSLVASLFIITPGLLNSLFGFILLIPPVSIKLGSRMARIIGIDWQEAHEFLRLERITENPNH